VAVVEAGAQIITLSGLVGNLDTLLLKLCLERKQIGYAALVVLLMSPDFDSK
jgi:hypothetical protein